MYWKEISSRAWVATDKKSPSAIALAAITTILNYLLQWRAGVRTFQTAWICIAVGLAVYVLIIAGQFLLKFFGAIGDDQDSKKKSIEDSIQQLTKLLHPQLAQKAQRTIETLENHIQEADLVFTRPPITKEKLSEWTARVEFYLSRSIGQSSDWYEQFARGVEQARIEPHLNVDQVLLFRRVALLRDIIDDIKRQRVLVTGA